MHAKTLIAIVFVLVTGTLWSQGQPNLLQKYVKEWCEDPFLENAGISIYVYDLNANKVMAKRNPTMSLVPASTMKVVTTASALEILGQSYRFKTRIQYTGEIDSAGVLHGDLIIKGGADPSLGSGYYPNFNADFMAQWTEAIKAGHYT